MKGIYINLIIEIVSMILIIFVSFPLWQSFNNDEIINIAKENENKYYITYDLYNQNDKNKLTIYNATNTIEDYNIILNFDNCIDEDTDIIIDGVNNKIKDYIKIKDNNSCKYIIKYSNLVSGYKEYEISVNTKEQYDINVTENV